MSFAPALVLLALTATPEPGPLADLDAVLARFAARDPLRARFTHRFEVTNGDGKDQVHTQGEVTGELAEGEAGLAITWPRVLLDRAREEEQARSANPEAKAPTRDAIATMNTMELAGYLDAAGTLRQELEGAKLKEDRQDVLDGVPARLLVLEVSPGLSARDRRYVKEVAATLRLWLGEGGVPVAADADVKASGRVMLVVSFKSEQHESFRFEQVGDRLVAVRHEASRRSEGAGEKGERKTTTVLAFAKNGAQPIQGR
jgi:hypothetical protein